MKRKRGNKRSKSKKKLAVEATMEVHDDDDDVMSGNGDDTEENSGSSSSDGDDDDETDSKAETEKESQSQSQRQLEAAGKVGVRAEGGGVAVLQRPPTTAVYGRVKLKLKAAKAQPAPLPVVEAVRVRVDEGERRREEVNSGNVEKEGREEGVGGGGKGEGEGGVNSMGGESKKVGGIRIVSKNRQEVDSSVEKGQGAGEDSENSMPESKKLGGIKIVSRSRQEGENSSEGKGQGEGEIVGGGGEKGEDGLSSEMPESKKLGGIKIVSKNREDGSVEKQQGGEGVVVIGEKSEDSSGSERLQSKKFGGIKIVSKSREDGCVEKLQEGEGVVVIGEKSEDSSGSERPKNKKFGGIKIVSKSREDGSVEKLQEGEGVVVIDEKSEDSSGSERPKSKKFGGIKIVSKSRQEDSGSMERQPGEERVVVGGEKGEDSSSSMVPESKKYGGIKIVSSKGSSPPAVKESGVVGEKGVESGNSMMPESKKLGGFKIVSSKEASPPRVKESGVSGILQGEKREREEPKVGQRGSRYNKQELEASLEVVTKIMKMDAAEPFNVPVNPIELGIPDYFDVIDTPMDFGTVRRNLESGTKYLDSEDVFKDVQYIWDNCFKYNNKGDYVVDLMKRVKKNFMKYWMAAGLYTEQTKKTNGGESVLMEEATTSGHGKKIKRGRGFKLHKDDCMCAICIMKRRRREREAREAQEAREAGGQAASPLTEVTIGTPQEFKREGNSHTESPCGDDTSSYLETSPDADADVEMEDREETGLNGAGMNKYYDEQKVEDDRADFHDKYDKSGDFSEKSQRSDKGETESYHHIEAKVPDESATGQKQLSVQLEGHTAGHLQQRNEQFELEKKRQRLRLIETFRDLENPMILGLCGTLFPNNHRSVWNGANSLVRSQKSHHKSKIHDAVASFMTPVCKSASSRK